jgi:hypothetical protein
MSYISLSRFVLVALFAMLFAQLDAVAQIQPPDPPSEEICCDAFVMELERYMDPVDCSCPPGYCYKFKIKKKKPTPGTLCCVGRIKLNACGAAFTVCDVKYEWPCTIGHPTSSTAWVVSNKSSTCDTNTAYLTVTDYDVQICAENCHWLTGKICFDRVPPLKLYASFAISGNTAKLPGEVEESEWQYCDDCYKEVVIIGN